MTDVDQVGGLRGEPTHGAGRCPFLTPHLVCDAAVRALRPPHWTRTRFCANEDHADCPLFLAHVLRRSA